MCFCDITETSFSFLSKSAKPSNVFDGTSLVSTCPTSFTPLSVALSLTDQGYGSYFQKVKTLINFIKRSFYYSSSMNWWHKNKKKIIWFKGFFCRSKGFWIDSYQPIFPNIYKPDLRIFRQNESHVSSSSFYGVS